MSTTTAADLLDRAHALTRDLRSDDAPPTASQWDAFDDTIHRVLTNLLGPHGRNIPMRSERRLQLITIAQTYPNPLRDNALAATPVLPPHKPAGFRRPPYAATRSHLHAVIDDEATLPTLPDLNLPSPTDPHPLDRLTCSLGALADMLVDASAQDLTLERGDLADATARVLAVAAVGARHALSVGSLEAGERRLAVGQWAERCLDRLGTRTANAAALDRIAATHPDHASKGLNARLEAARVDWTAAAQAEVGQLIPSVDVLRIFANQGAHLYGLTAHLIRQNPDLARDADALVPPLAQAAVALRAADQEWAGLTTLTRPSHEFLTESRRLLDVLKAVAAQTNSTAPEQLDPGRAMADLVALSGTVADVAAATNGLPDRLLRSHLLFGTADRLLDPLQRLNKRTGLGAIPLSSADAPTLNARWQEAIIAAHTAAQAMAPLRIASPHMALAWCASD